jgi:sec-independent protein translocase protein TatC
VSDNPDDHKMPLMEHLIELRRRLLISSVAFILSFILCYYFAKEIYGFLVRPLADILATRGENRRMIYTALTEAFFTYMKVAAFSAAFVCFPVWAGQLWAFVAPGLYKHEKKAFAPFLAATPVLFLAGAATVYYLVLPVAWKFFLSFETMGVASGGLPIELEAKVGEYLSLVMKLIFAFGVAFQMPVLLTLLARVGIISSADLVAKRRYAIVGVFIAAAILTPPDIISQLSLAVPMLILYEVSIFSCRWVEKSMKAAKVEPEDPVEETDFNAG